MQCFHIENRLRQFDYCNSIQIGVLYSHSTLHIDCMNFTPKQIAFVNEYMICRNGAQAARRAGYGVLSARVTASRLLTKANIKAELAVKEAELARTTEITKLRVVNEVLASITMAENKVDPSTALRGWVEIAKMLDLYKPDTTIVAPSAENDVLRAKYETMSDEQLMVIVSS